MANNISGMLPTGTPSFEDILGAQRQATSFTQQLPLLESKLREAISERFMGSPLFGQREQALEKFLQAPAQARQGITELQAGGQVLSPTQQQAIMSSQRAAAYAPVQTSNLMLGQAFGGMEDILGQGVRGFEAAGQGAGQQANILAQLRQMGMGEAQQEWQRGFQEKQLAQQQAGRGAGGLTAWQQMQLEQQQLEEERGFTQQAQAEDTAAAAIQGASTAEEVQEIIASLSKEITDPAFVAKLTLAGQKRIQEINESKGILEKILGLFRRK